MDIFRSVTQTVLGSQQPESQPSGADTVERLLDRVQSSTLIEDRRDGCRAIKALSRKYRLLVGAHGMDILIQVLSADRSDHEIVNYALETLVNITSEEIFSEEGEEELPQPDENAKMGERFTEIFAKKPGNIALLMDLLDEFDFKVRFPAMKLLNNLLIHQPKDIQESILVLPSGVSKLMDMLSDTREVIRNDTLLLLTYLTKGNTNLQKIVVFENAYDYLFQIVSDEGDSDGGVVVQDCLTLMHNLLYKNPSNQTLFLEGPYMQKMVQYFTLTTDDVDIGWTAQKVANVHFMLKLVKNLVSPQNTGQIVSSSQKKIHACGLLENLCSLLMATGVPADILSDTISTVSDIIRGSQENQEFFSGIMAPSNPPRPAIVVLLMSMVNEKQPFVLRCAVLYCFQCFLFRNPTSQAQIIQTLLPQTADANQVTAGQLLCGGLFSNDPVSNWFSAIALSHALLDNTTQKEQLLRVQLATGVGSPPVSLLHQISSLLEGGSKLTTRLGLLQLLSMWVAHCPRAVSHLLGMPAVVTHLTAYLSANEQDENELLCQGVCAFLVGLCNYFNDGSVTAFNRQALTQLISNRVGVENFANKVENILRTEAYAKAAKSPQLNVRQPSEILFDHEFTKMFKSLEGSVLGSITPQLTSGTPPCADVIRYEESIKEKNAIIGELKQTLANTRAQLDEVNSEVAALRSELDALRESKDTKIGDHPTAVNGLCLNSNNDQQVEILQQQLTEMTYARDYYYYQMSEKDTLLQKYASSGNNSQGSILENGETIGNNTQNIQKSSETSTLSTPNPELENVLQQLSDLQLALHKKDETIRLLEETKNMPVESDQNIVKLISEKLTIETALEALKNTKNHLEKQLEDAQNRNEILETKLNKERGSIDKEQRSFANEQTEQQCKTLQKELHTLQSEQEDLLILLTDQETKITAYRERLLKLGEELSDDDSNLDLDDLT